MPSKKLGPLMNHLATERTPLLLLSVRCSQVKKAAREITSAADLARKAKELRAQAEKKTPLLWQYPSKMSTESLHALREAKIELVQPDQPKRNQTLGDRLNSHKVN